MDNRELLEIQRTLRSHEEHVHCNRSSICNLASKLHDLETQISTQMAKIMDTLLEVKKLIG
jgi:hypothetical protein